MSSTFCQCDTNVTPPASTSATQDIQLSNTECVSPCAAQQTTSPDGSLACELQLRRCQNWFSCRLRAALDWNGRWRRFAELAHWNWRLAEFAQALQLQADRSASLNWFSCDVGCRASMGRALLLGNESSEAAS